MSISSETQRAVIDKRAERKGKAAIAKKNKVLERLNIEYVPIDSVKPNEYNPNRQSEHDFELLLRSMEEDGFTQPIITNMENIIVDGEHRWRAASALGYKDIPVVRVEMSAEQMRISTIRHNRARGTHDISLEAEVLRDLQQLGAIDWAQDSLMLDDVELNRLLNDIPAPDALAAEEFNEAWVPDVFTEDEVALLKQAPPSVEAQEHARAGGVAMSGMTAEAIEQQRKREELIARAKTEQDKAALKRDGNLFYVNLAFSDSEAQDIKDALGDRPAEALLNLAKTQATPASEEDGWKTLTFVVPKGALELIEQELSRLQRLAPNRNDQLRLEVQRGLALEYMAVLSSQTPDESITA